MERPTRPYNRHATDRRYTTYQKTGNVRRASTRQEQLREAINAAWPWNHVWAEGSD